MIYLSVSHAAPPRGPAKASGDPPLSLVGLLSLMGPASVHPSVINDNRMSRGKMVKRVKRLGSKPGNLNVIPGKGGKRTDSIKWSFYLWHANVPLPTHILPLPTTTAIKGGAQKHWGGCKSYFLTQP